MQVHQSLHEGQQEKRGVGLIKSFNYVADEDQNIRTIQCSDVILEHQNKKRFLHWKMLIFNSNNERACLHVIIWVQYPTIPFLNHIFTFSQSKCSPHQTFFTNQFVVIWRNHCQITKMNGRTHYIWIDLCGGNECHFIPLIWLHNNYSLQRGQVLSYANCRQPTMHLIP